MFSRKRTLSFLMCYASLATAMYVVSVWLASDIHIKQVLTVESRQVIIQNRGDFIDRGQNSEMGVVVHTKTINEAGGLKDETRSKNEGPKYSLKIMTAMKKMQEESNKIKGEQLIKNNEKETKVPIPVKGKPQGHNKNGDQNTQKDKGGNKDKGKSKGSDNKPGALGKSGEQKKQGDKQKKDKNETAIKGNSKDNNKGKGDQGNKKGIQKGDPKKANPGSLTSRSPADKPKKPEIPVPELIYGLFRQPRLNNLDTTVQIPHIVHQTWKETLLPLSLKPFLQSWKKYNPTWEYWFWTDADARLLVQTRFPDLLGMYDNFEKAVQRADVIRYFILYEFGGIYADLDVEALKPLENFTKPHHCIISNEPLLHTFLIWKRDRLPCNAFMASIPKHPFFKFLISRLPVYDKRTRRSEVMLKTGPLMLDVAMGEYERSYVKRENQIRPADKCYLAPPEEAMPSFDPAARGWFIFTCRRKQRVPEKRRHVCDPLIKNKFQDAPIPASAFANHRWMHSWSNSHKPFDRKYRPKLTSSIHNIVDNVTLPSDKILEQPTMQSKKENS